MGKSGNKVEKHVRLGKCGKFGKKVSANRAFKKNMAFLIREELQEHLTL